MKKKIAVVMVLSFLLAGCSSKTINRSYSCEANGNTFMAEFSKDGTVLLGSNGSAMEYEYEKIDKDVYRIYKFGVPTGEIVATKEGFAPVGVGEGRTHNHKKVLPCKVK